MIDIRVVYDRVNALSVVEWLTHVLSQMDFSIAFPLF